MAKSQKEARQAPTRGKGQRGPPKTVQHRYQPRIQERGLAEAWVGVHGAAGGETAQAKSTCKSDRSEGGSHRPTQVTTLAQQTWNNRSAVSTLEKRPLQWCTATLQAWSPTTQMLFSF